MRPLILAAILLLVPAPAAAQPPGVAVCVTAPLPVPEGGWTAPTLALALAEGRATIAEDPATCGEEPVTAVGEARTIFIGFTLRDRDEKWKKGETCRGRGGYSDIQRGAPVTVKDAAGTILGATTLEAGEAASRTECDWFFSIAVPDSDVYQVEVSRRGALVYSREEREEQGWLVSAGIG